MAYPYNVADWYWKVGDTNPTTHRFSSASGTYVVLADATYAAWVAAGNTATNIPTEAGLYRDVINQAANDAWKGRGWSYASYSQTSNLTLTNPAASRLNVKFTDAVHHIILPKQNMPNSIPLGIPVTIKSDSSAFGIYRIYAQDAATIVHAEFLTKPGDTIIITPLTNNTQNGTFAVDVIPWFSGMTDGQVLIGSSAGYSPQISAFSGVIIMGTTGDMGFRSTGSGNSFNNLTEDTSPDPAADHGLTYDASAGQVKKAKLKNLNPVIGARAYNSANISLADSTVTTLTFDSERFDTDTIHSTSSNTGRLTATTAGKYLIAGNISYDANAVGIRLTRIRLNGATVIANEIRQAATTGDVTIVALSTIYDLAAGDYVELQGYQSSGGNLNVLTAANYSPEFMMTRLGA